MKYESLEGVGLLTSRLFVYGIIWLKGGCNYGSIIYRVDGENPPTLF